MFTTNKRLLCCKEALNHGSEFKILWDTFRSQIAELWFPFDRRRSQTIAEVCFHMIADDRRAFCDLRSAIRDRLRSYGNQPLDLLEMLHSFIKLSSSLVARLKQFFQHFFFQEWATFSAQKDKSVKFLLSLNSQQRLGYKENTTELKIESCPESPDAMLQY